LPAELKDARLPRSLKIFARPLAGSSEFVYAGTVGHGVQRMFAGSPARIRYAYPQLRRYWFEVRFRDAQLDHARRELEVLKLRYEIEALAKEKGLPLPAWPVMMRNLPSGEAAPSTVLSKLIGGILPSLRFFYASPVAFSLSSSVW
jgi:hypothetical protein